MILAHLIIPCGQQCCVPTIIILRDIGLHLIIIATQGILYHVVNIHNQEQFDLLGSRPSPSQTSTARRAAIIQHSAAPAPSDPVIPRPVAAKREAPRPVAAKREASLFAATGR